MKCFILCPLLYYTKEEKSNRFLLIGIQNHTNNAPYPGRSTIITGDKGCKNNAPYLVLFKVLWKPLPIGPALVATLPHATQILLDGLETEDSLICYAILVAVGDPRTPALLYTQCVATLPEILQQTYLIRNPAER